MLKSIGSSNSARKFKRRRQMLAATVTSVYYKMKQDKTFLKRVADAEKEKAAAKKARKAEARQQLADIRAKLASMPIQTPVQITPIPEAQVIEPVTITNGPQPIITNEVETT